jgi:ABC-type nitrate/sulfonate/bicarbonate transport system substrate-binding protein
MPRAKSIRSRWSEVQPVSLLFVVLTFALSACSGGKSKPPETSSDYELNELRYHGMAGMVTVPELAEDLGYLAPVTLKFVGNTISGPQDIQAVATGDTDFGLAFNGAIIKLIAAKVPIRAVVAGYGVDPQTFSGFYVLDDSPIRSARDLIGKKIAVNTLGAHHEFMLREYLQRNGLSGAEAKQVELIVLPPLNTEQALRQKQVEVATLSDMLRDKALERGGIRLLFSDLELFGTFTASSYALSQRFLARNPKTARKFVEAVGKAIEWARAAPREQVVARMQAIIAKRKRDENADALRYWKSTGIAAKGGTLSAREFQLWLDWLVREHELEAGAVALRDVFSNEWNPYSSTR